MTRHFRLPERRWAALLVVLGAAFMDLVDVTIVGVALRPIQSDLGASYATGQWITAGYALAFALLLVTGGRLGDIHGRRRVFMIGVAGFTVASALAATAVTPGMLITARIAQGAFGGVMVPQVMSIIATEFPLGRGRTAAISLYGIVLGLGQVSGPLLGGLLAGGHATGHGGASGAGFGADPGTGLGGGVGGGFDGGLDAGFGVGWRAIFLVNIPIGLAALAGAARWLRESRADRPERLDLAGVLLISVTSFLLAYPLVQGREQGWPPWAVASLIAGVPMAAAFTFHQRRRERAGRPVLVPTRLFRLRSFSGGLVLLLVLFCGVSGYFIVLAWTLQFGLGWTPMHVALTGLAWPAGIACTAQLTNRFGPPRARLLVRIGTPIMTLGTAGLAATVLDRGNAVTTWDLTPWMFGAGVGMGLTIPILSNLVLGELPEADAGAASGLLNSVIQIGNALGVALGGVIFFGEGGAAPADFPGAGARALLCSAAAFALAALLSPLLPRRVPGTGPGLDDERPADTSRLLRTDR
ncbi:MFS transporter [Actinomadura barringtoniae]|uniref:MFS transporter n=1 Tax=Actinomadura barringtoniae TaxID=1427535 RepID=A0A939P916_9ACTN|nr:MFS transporter [Actinomadura barringtoniae]MBO2448317.1 MFS transporter [Actinomadura barringtoniae]